VIAPLIFRKLLLIGSIVFFYQLSYAQELNDTISNPSQKQRGFKASIDADTSTTPFIAISDTMFADTSSSSQKVVSKEKKHNPKKAVWMSAVLPGLGQAYNKKYWKIPIFYAGLGGIGYAVYYTSSNFIQARDAYRLQVDNDPKTIGTYQRFTDANTLKAQRDFHNRNLTISSICLVVWYSLNLIDAAVDAHLFNFDMKDDLSLEWGPHIQTPQPYSPVAQSYGLRFAIKFKN
jgi:hypothetical protein